MSKHWIFKKNVINLQQINKQEHYGKLKERKNKESETSKN